MYKGGPLFGLAASPHAPTTATPSVPSNGRGGAGPVGGGSLQPMMVAPKLTTLDPLPSPAADTATRAPAGRGAGRGGFGAAGAPSTIPIGVASTSAPRVLLSYPTDPNDLLLSGELVGGDLAGRRCWSASIGKGAVMFASRPFWRFQTRNFFLAFSAILN